MSDQERVLAAVPNAAGVRTRAEVLLKRLDKGGDIDDDYVIALLNKALARPLVVAEARYLERCVFDVQGPSEVQEAPPKK